jgi:microcin C transport system substrate-binding protein
VHISRRSIIRTGMMAAALPALGRPFDFSWSTPAGAQQPPAEPQWRHAAALMDQPRYPQGFAHFDYVNPAAPKGGVVRLSTSGTFDNFNTVVSGVKGALADAVAMTYDPLMVDALDEVASKYGMLAEAMSYPPDVSSAVYRLRAQARWHDGKPVTPEDVIFSFDSFKQISPMYSAYYRHVAKAEKTGEREVTFTFDAPGNRELPFIVGELVVLPRHWWEGTDASGKKRDIAATTLEPPLGSGQYRIKSFNAGRDLVLERVKDYWGRDLNVKVGQDNFDEVHFEYFRDLTVAFAGFKGDQIDWQLEGSAKNWATGYDFPAIKDKRVVREEFSINNMGLMQAYAFNTRRDKFKDARVRRAFNFAFDFEEMNKQLFFNQYKRISSYFDGSELAWNASGDDLQLAGVPKGPAGSGATLPQGLELEILEKVRDQVPPEVFTTPYSNPVGGNPTAVRNNQREALRLLKEAGYELRDRRLVDTRSGQPFTAELLIQDPSYERFAVFYKPTLDQIGITLTVRTVDDVQYQNRLRSWDFDIVVEGWAESLSPGNEQREFWGSQSADVAGSHNYIGIKNPAVDALIDRVIFAKSRAELVAATRALDRVLLWNHYVVPQFNYPFDRTARWDRFGHPDPAKYSSQGGFPQVWWWDAARAAKIGSRT